VKGIRIILRAVLRSAGEPIVGHTVSLDRQGTWVVVPELAQLGELFDLELSFPPVIAPVTLKTEVIERRPRGDAPGELDMMHLEFREQSAAAQRRFETLCATISAPRVERKSSYRVLLVEDNALVRDMFSYGLQRYFRGRSCAVEVEFAETGQEGLSKLTEGGFDLAIVDYYLPVMTGGQLVRKLRVSPVAGHIPVVGVSVGGAEAREDFLAAGADIFLDKPLILRDLMATLDGLTAREQA